MHSVLGINYLNIDDKNGNTNKWHAGPIRNIGVYFTVIINHIPLKFNNI